MQYSSFLVVVFGALGLVGGEAEIRSGLVAANTGISWDTVVLRDDFDYCPGPPDPNKWIINHPDAEPPLNPWWWTRGRTHFPDPTPKPDSGWQGWVPTGEFPRVERVQKGDEEIGVCVIEHHLFNPWDSPDDDETVPRTFLGGEIHTVQEFDPNRSYRIEARVRSRGHPSGLISSFFLYGDDGPPDPRNDEIDFEFVSKLTHDNTTYPDGDPVLTNTWNESFERPEYVMPPGLDLTEWNTFRIYWYPQPDASCPSGGCVEWSWLDPVNRETWLRTEANTFFVPDEPMNVYFNFWAPCYISWNPDCNPWDDAADPDLQAVNTPCQNEVYRYEIDYVEVRVPGQANVDTQAKLTTSDAAAGIAVGLAGPLPARGVDVPFTERVISTAADGAISVFATDVDGDGDTDVLSASYYDDKIAWYESDGGSPPSFTERVISTAAQNAFSVFATDVDGDGDTDVLSASWRHNKIAWYESDGGSPPAFTERVISTAAIGAHSVFATDVDGDGDTDVLSASINDDKIAWYENTAPSIVCGDGVIEGAEACDDGFTDECGTCNADCTGPGTCSTCGDGELCPEFEECDDASESHTCDTDCTFVLCGDGTLNVTAGEDCEPPGCDCCDASCHFDPSGTACGDPSDTPCDDPDTCDGTGTCLPNLAPPETSCDDGDICNGVEVCDGSGICVSQLLGDCNQNEVEDSCDIEGGTSQDCNDNDIPDECDIADGTSPDENDNGIPDECELAVYLDIKPGSCPNPVNPRSKGVVPVAIVGSTSFDVAHIDTNTLALRRTDGVGVVVTPLSGPPRPGITTDDVATPFAGDLCDCHDLGGDGIDDLLLKFSTPELTGAFELSELPSGASLLLTLSGSLLDGTAFEASDCVVIPGKPARARPHR